MDTTTVLEIIKMIDERTVKAKAFLNRVEEHLFPYEIEQQKGKISGFQIISGHLQSFIEGELNAAENQTAE